MEINSTYRNEVMLCSLNLLYEDTLRQLASALDSSKILLTEDKLYRDWRGLAELAKLDISTIQNGKISCTEYCIRLWTRNGGEIKDLINALEAIDRFDVIVDNIALIYADYDRKIEKEATKGLIKTNAHNENLDSVSDFDSNVLTTDDQKNLKEGGELQYYDALVLFDDADFDFVDTMVLKLEGEFFLKLCLKERDLIGGLSFEFSAMMRLIEERCGRVVVVLSPNFLESNANKFLTRFAHALSIDQQRRILIPCMYKPCQKPMELSFSHSLDYFRAKRYWDYWQKLADSIMLPKISCIDGYAADSPRRAPSNRIQTNAQNSITFHDTAVNEHSSKDSENTEKSSKNNTSLKETVDGSLVPFRQSTHAPIVEIADLSKPGVKNFKFLRKIVKNAKKKKKILS